jgi:hypothetical protein
MRSDGSQTRARRPQGVRRRRAAALAGSASALLALMLWGSACSRDKGAVVVRWRLIDGSTGTSPNGSCSGRQASAGAGGCCGLVHSDRDGLDPAATHAVTIDRIRLHVQRVADADAGLPASLEQPCSSCCFSCTPSEHTTNFELCEGNYKLWLEALRCGRPVGDVPPAVVRRVTAGEITNLDAIEIRINPSTVTPAACDVDAGTAAGPTCTAVGSTIPFADGGC